MSEQKKHHKDVGKFYESEITKFWEMVHKKHMHVGYWDETNPANSQYEASKRLTDMMINWAEVKEGERFIDIGCGYGVPGRALAVAKGCEVIGVTASEYQSNDANKMAQEEGLIGKAKFQVADANELPFADADFDGAWFFESIFHMGHESALQEAHRILKPGSMLLIADFPRLGTINEDDMAFIKKNFFVNTLISMDEYPPLLEKTGFELIKLLDITKETMPRTWAGYLPEVHKHKDELLKIGGDDLYNFMKELWPKVESIIVKNLGYCIVFARKI